MYDEILVEIRDRVGVIIINRPEASNAMNWLAQESFAKAVESFHNAEGLRVVIITATGDRAFVSGGDIKELGKDLTPAAGSRLNTVMGTVLDRLIKLPLPVIAAVNGDAIGGGCEILTACDLRIASNHARFRFGQVNVALTTGWGGTGRLVRLLGLSRALELLLTGREFNVQEGMDYGFIHRQVAAGESVLTAARRWADELILLPRFALSASKELAWSSTQNDLVQINRMESTHFGDLWLKPDHLEALVAFSEKRKANFNRDEG